MARLAMVVAACIASRAVARHEASHGTQPLVRALPGGLVVLAEESRAVPSVALTVVVDSGAADERPAEAGAAHFLEHLLFDGTTTRSQAEVQAAADRMGLYTNAFTRRDYTAFQALGRAQDLEAMAGLLADMLFRSTLPPDQVEKERGVILEEIAQDASRSGPSARDAFERVVLGVLPATGTPEAVKTLPRDSVRSAWIGRYRPDRMVVLVNGAVDPQQAARVIEKAFPARRQEGGPAAARPALPALAWVPAGGPVREVEPQGGEPDAGFLAFPLELKSDRDVTSGLVLESLLGDRLAASPAGADGEAWIDPSARLPLLVVRAGASEASLGTLEVWLKALPSALGDADVARACRALDAHDLMEAEQPHYFAFHRADLLAARRFSTVAALGRLEDQVPAATVRDLATRLFAGPRLRLLVRSPGKATESAAAAPSASPAVPPAAAVPGRRQVEAGLVTETLPNGLRVVALASPGSSVFGAVMLFGDKEGHERAACLPGAAEVLHRTFLEGTRLRSKASLEADLESMGMELKVVDDPSIPFDDYTLSPRYGYVRLKCPASSGERGLALLGELIGAPRLDEEAVAAARTAAELGEAQGARGGRQALDMDFVRRVIARDPWPPRGTQEGLARVTAQGLVSFAQGYLAPSNAVLAVVSPWPGPQCLDRIEAAFRMPSLAAEKPTTACAGPGEDPPGPPAPQARLALGERLEVAPSDAAALEAATAYLSDRIAADVRETRGLAYAVGASCSTRPGDSWFRVSLGTRPENLDKAEAAVRDVVRTTLDAPFLDDAFRASQARGAGRLLMRSLPSDNRAFSLALSVLDGRDPATALAAAPDVEPEISRQVARRLLHPLAWQALSAR